MRTEPRERDLDEPFLAALRRNARPIDPLALASAPAVLVVAFLLPDPVRSALVFSSADPTALAAYTTHFVHLGVDHLLVDLLAYAMVVPVAYVLCTVAGRRRGFYVVFSTVLLAFPVVLSVLSLAVLGFGRLSGFSGLVMAFAGFLPLAVFDYLGAHLRGRVGIHDSPGVFFFGIALIAALIPVRSTRYVAVAAGLIALAYAGVLVHRLLLDLPRLRRSLGRAWYVEAAVLALGVFVVSLVSAFPSDPATGDGVINLYVHLLGYGLGYVAAYATFVLDRWLFPSGTPR